MIHRNILEELLIGDLIFQYLSHHSNIALLNRAYYQRVRGVSVGEVAGLSVETCREKLDSSAPLRSDAFRRFWARQIFRSFSDHVVQQIPKYLSITPEGNVVSNSLACRIDAERTVSDLVSHYVEHERALESVRQIQGSQDVPKLKSLLEYICSRGLNMFLLHARCLHAALDSTDPMVLKRGYHKCLILLMTLEYHQHSLRLRHGRDQMRSKLIEMFHAMLDKSQQIKRVKNLRMGLGLYLVLVLMTMLVTVRAERIKQYAFNPRDDFFVRYAFDLYMELVCSIIGIFIGGGLYCVERLSDMTPANTRVGQLSRQLYQSTALTYRSIRCSRQEWYALFSDEPGPAVT